MSYVPYGWTPEPTQEQVQILLDWAEDLESGNRIQTKERLTRLHPDGSRSHCCLGVLSDRAAQAGVLNAHLPTAGGQVAYGDYREHADLPVEVQQWTGLIGGSPSLQVPEHLQYKLGQDSQTLYRGSGRVSAMSLNDVYDFTFPEIAECIRFTFGGGEKA